MSEIKINDIYPNSVHDMDMKYLFRLSREFYKIVLRYGL